VPCLCFARPFRYVRAQATLEDPQEKIIHYDSPVGRADPVTLLQQRVAAGTARLKFDAVRGYLPSLLKELRVPVSSQGLVFSKSSSQRHRINPQTPAPSISVILSLSAGCRAAMSSNWLRWIRNAARFFTRWTKRTVLPRDLSGARTACKCHLGPKTVNVPGLVVRSVLTDSNGVASVAGGGFCQRPQLAAAGALGRLVRHRQRTNATDTWAISFSTDAGRLASRAEGAIGSITRLRD